MMEEERIILLIAVETTIQLMRNNCRESSQGEIPLIAQCDTDSPNRVRAAPVRRRARWERGPRALTLTARVRHPENCSVFVWDCASDTRSFSEAVVAYRR